MLPLCKIAQLSHAEAVTVQGDSLVMQNTAKCISSNVIAVTPARPVDGDRKDTIL